MKAAIERWLHSRWYGDVAPGAGLKAVAGLYRLVAQSSRQLADVQPIPVPVIVVGNFTAGGTGKTPLTIALATFLGQKGFRPAIISRGYGRSSSAALRVTSSTPASECGDEPRLMFDRTGMAVFVDADRVAAAHAAVAAGCDVIIADDGLQHRRLGRDVEIEVVDGERGYGNGLMLPAGPLREAPRPCDFRVFNGRGASAHEWTMELVLGDAESLARDSARQPLAAFAGKQVNAVAAIGNPQRFFSALRAAGLDIAEHAFEDHHEFRAGDFKGMRGPVLMTEKDAVKCRALALPDAWSVPVEARLPEAFLTEVLRRVESAHVRP